MKILVDCVPISVGGGIQVAIALIVNLREQTEIEWEAVVPTQMEAALPPEIAGDARVILVSKVSQFDRIGLRKALICIERAFAPDVVFTVFGPPYFQARAPHVVGFALPCLIYDREGLIPAATPFERLADWLRCVMLRRADHLVVETQTIRDRLARRLRIDPAGISVIGNSVNPLLVREADTASVPAGCFNFLIPSAYYLHKNLEIVPRVAAAMRRLDSDLDFAFRFTLKPDGGHWKALAARAKRLGVADRLITLGVLRLEHLARAYCEASAVFLPTLREASTAVYPESFYFQRPLVTSDMDFAREMCGNAALFVAPLAPEEIAVRLIGFARSPEMRSRLVKSGIQQLARAYPEAKDKFAMQLAMLAAVSKGKKVAIGGVPPVFGQEDQASSDPQRELKDIWDHVHLSGAVDFHDRIVRDWDSKYLTGGFRRRADFFRREIMPLITKPGRWLDAGCGSGYFSRILSASGIQVTGIDASASMIQAATEIAMQDKLSDRLQFQVIETIERLSYPDESFAGCICLSVVEYLDRPYRCLDELARVLEPGGTLILSVPHTYSPVGLAHTLLASTLTRSNSSKWRYRSHSNFSTTQHELRKSFSRRGLRLRKIIGFDAVLPAFLLSYCSPSLMFAIATRTDREGVE
jgi:2-polyprenyl-3-methyl-5-hydroxy-6-metoxy-1,4-benzoquinol methylase/glycosyltransferase involved in cell wall biosynthesis